MLEPVSTRDISSGSENWGNQAPRDRVAQIGNFVAMTPSLRQSMNFIRSQMDRYGTAPEGAISFLLGETRAGKTTAINEFIADCAEESEGKIVNQLVGDGRSCEAMVSVVVPTPTGIERPIIKIFVPVGPTFNGLLADVLLALDIKLPRSATFAQRQLALGRQLRGQATRLIIFDDTQHICEKGRVAAAYEASEVLKVLAKVVGAQVLCAGLEHTIEIKDANAQVEWLGGELHVVRPHQPSARRDTALAIFCATMNGELPFDQVSHLDQPEVFLPLAVLCEGYEGRMALIVKDTVHYAIENDLPCLDRRAFAAYLRHRRGVRDRDNPFEMTEDELERLPKIIARTRKDRLVEAEKRRSRASRRRNASGACGL